MGVAQAPLYHPMQRGRRRGKERKPILKNPTAELPLSYFYFTKEMLNSFIRHNVSATGQRLYAILELDKDKDTGQIHKRPISFYSEVLEVSEPTIYRQLAELKEIGMFNPSDWGYISGTLPYALMANITVKNASKEAKIRTFYQALNKDIKNWEKENDKEASRSVIAWLYTALVERRRADNLYTHDPHGKIVQTLEQYAPLSTFNENLTS